MKREIIDAYIRILKQELVPAMGCTEPIAVAYAGALARETLGRMPDAVELAVSGNIIKNVKSVIVPHTMGRRGLETAVAVGICCGDAKRELQVISDVTDDMLPGMEKFLARTPIGISEAASDCPFDIRVTVKSGPDSALVRIAGSHTNVVRVERNGEALTDRPFTHDASMPDGDRELLNVRDIVEFADTVELEPVRETLLRQIELNMDIANEGMRGHYGAEIGKILIRSYGNSVQNRAKAYAAAGSDARMNGCEKPVIINSGSGNQGLTASVPVIIYARECGVSEDQLLRALLVSNLVTIHLKTGIGSLSAYCGATSAGAGAGAGICYLYGGGYDEIAHTVVNALGINSGMLCDGAKASCAAKIASAVEAGLLGMQMYMHDSEFKSGEGLTARSVEDTIRAVSEVAREGMRETDRHIIHQMINNG